MKTKNLTPIAKSFLVAVIFATTTLAANAQIIGTVDETYPGLVAPTTNVISSYTPALTGAIGPYNFGSGSTRDISTSFLTPGDSDYLVSALTMQIGNAATSDFPSAVGYTLDVYSLTSQSNAPTSIGSVLVGNYTGSMQPAASDIEMNDYFTFTLSTPFTATAGVNYSFILKFTSGTATNILRMAVSGSGAGTGRRALESVDGGSWANSDTTYINYVQGVAVPEPGSLGLLAIAGVGALLVRRRARQSV